MMGIQGVFFPSMNGFSSRGLGSRFDVEKTRTRFPMTALHEENDMIEHILELEHQIASMQFEKLEKTKSLRSHFQSLTEVVLIHLDYDTHGTLYNVCRPIGSTGARILAEALQGNQKLLNVELGFNDIGNQGLQYVGKILETTNLEELDLVYSGFDAQGIREFCPFFGADDTQDVGPFTQ
jgi:hypothetical protein